jgi:DNA-binding MarR family transcriptional regulator
MRQAETVGPLENAVGYVLKQAATALRAAMEQRLRPLDLTVPQYACLELLGQHPGLSNAELARGAFVSRQSMNGVLRGLQDRELVSRPALAPHGRARPTQLTASGRAAVDVASAAVRDVERRMLATLDIGRQHELLAALRACTAALTDRPVDDAAD